MTKNIEPSNNRFEMLSILVKADRDSVCAGDDCESHQVIFSVPASHTVLDLLSAAWSACPLPDIAGGEATWLIEIGRSSGICIGVMAQQWMSPQLTLSTATTTQVLFKDVAPSLHFRYWCQSNPDVVFEAVRTGATLPSPYAK
jgi:hypothetical protein